MLLPPDCPGLTSSGDGVRTLVADWLLSTTYGDKQTKKALIVKDTSITADKHIEM